MSILSTSARWIFVLSLPVLLITASLAGAVNNSWLYQYGFSKYQVSRTTGLAPSELDKAAHGLIRYFNSDEEYVSLTVLKEAQPIALFNPREISHLKDVKELIRLDYQVLLGALFFMLTYTVASLVRPRKRHSLAQSLLWGSGFTLALMLLAGLGTLLNFDQLFLQFHLISFTNELWQLDPAKDYLIMLFPQGFWYDATLFCALSTAALALITGGASSAYLRLSRNRGQASS